MIKPKPEYKLAIQKISRMHRLPPEEYKKAVTKIITRITFNELLDITIEANGVCDPQK